MCEELDIQRPPSARSTACWSTLGSRPGRSVRDGRAHSGARCATRGPQAKFANALRLPRCAREAPVNWCQHSVRALLHELGWRRRWPSTRPAPTRHRHPGRSARVRFAVVARAVTAAAAEEPGLNARRSRRIHPKETDTMTCRDPGPSYRPSRRAAAHGLARGRRRGTARFRERAGRLPEPRDHDGGAVPARRATDVVARLRCERLGRALKQAVIIENRPGANANIGTGAVAKAPADGYTVLYNTSSIVMSPALYRSLPHDLNRDFALVALTATVPLALVVNNDLPVRNVKEFVAYAKAHPGKLSYGSPAPAVPSHLAALQFAQAAGHRGDARALQGHRARRHRPRGGTAAVHDRHDQHHRVLREGQAGAHAGAHDTPSACPVSRCPDACRIELPRFRGAGPAGACSCSAPARQPQSSRSSTRRSIGCSRARTCWMR